MALPQGYGAWMGAFGSARSTPDGDAMCNAFVAAVEAWCVKGAAKSGPTKGHEFANVFFDKLREQSPDLAGSMTREAPMLMAKGAEAGSWTSVGMLEDLIKTGAGGDAAELAGKVLTGKTLLTGADTVAATWGKGFRWGCNKDLGRLAGGDYWTSPDFVDTPHNPKPGIGVIHDTT